ncbi:MAG TPA: HAMP domain-containing sensor histidine kinase, partial [Candidatus Saccharimonadales bacterium]|nr:HAMP domain-containing sensor histidine kinase [Candidatus Saccharimonadales bacterium]
FKLRARFILVLVLLLLAMFAAITFVIVRENTHTLRNGLVNQSKSFAALATQPIGSNFVLYSQSGTIRIHQKVDSFTALDPDINQVEIVDTMGNILFADQPDNQIPVPASAASAISPTYLHDQNGNLSAIVQPYLEDFGIHRYAVVYSISYANVDKSVREIVTLILSLSIAILLVSLVVWYGLINRLFLRPVARISKDTLRISQGDLEHQVRVGRNDEIGDLAAAVNKMAASLLDDIAKLKEVDRLKSEFLMITSHNLRTPLTVIDGYLSEIQGADSLEELQQLVQPIAASVKRLQGFAEDVLTISTVEAGHDMVDRQPMALQPVLEQVASDFEPLAREKKLQFVAHVATDAWAAIDRIHFHNALWNLLDNAYKFTPEGGRITLDVRSAGTQVEVVVSDSGIGIAAEELPKLFTKFHRGTDTLTYNYEGTGIGLYITRLLMRQLGGDAKVESEAGRGSTFTLSLPTVEPAAKSAA